MSDTLATVEHNLRFTPLNRRERRPSSKPFAAILCRHKAGDSALADDIPLELCNGAEHCIEHLPGRGPGVDVWMTTHPAARSASSCGAVVCSSVDTRA